MRRPENELKSKYYARNRERLLREAKSHRDAGLVRYNIPERVAAVEARRKANRLYFLWKLGGRCVDCGYSEHPSVLQFDHVDRYQKTHHVSSLMARVDREIIWAEVKKCVLRCANCHWIKSMRAGEMKPLNKKERRYVINLL